MNSTEFSLKYAINSIYIIGYNIYIVWHCTFHQLFTCIQGTFETQWRFNKYNIFSSKKKKKINEIEPICFCESSSHFNDLLVYGCFHLYIMQRFSTIFFYYKKKNFTYHSSWVCTNLSGVYSKTFSSYHFIQNVDKWSVDLNTQTRNWIEGERKRDPFILKTEYNKIEIHFGWLIWKECPLETVCFNSIKLSE